MNKQDEQRIREIVREELKAAEGTTTFDFCGDNIHGELKGSPENVNPHAL
ncbi:hypothetical protein NYE69_33430 [Paenibacillus sp. FSL R5-0527]